MIYTRSVRPANENSVGPFPEVIGAFAEWRNNMTFIMITDTVVDGINVKTPTSHSFNGIFQPMVPQKIFFRPEGERSWRWWTLWTTTEYDINIGDEVQDFNGVIYRVMSVSPWNQSGAGYRTFDLTQDYVKT